MGAVRFIPACAGNAPKMPARLAKRAVHPRMRGERRGVFDCLDNLIGSSPHARGTLLSYPVLASPKRFIPACAGNAHRAESCRFRDAVHPRMRGERTNP